MPSCRGPAPFHRAAYSPQLEICLETPYWEKEENHHLLKNLCILDNVLRLYLLLFLRHIIYFTDEEIKTQMKYLGI